MLAEMPIIGLGTYIGLEGKTVLPRDERLQVVEETIISALELGYRHLDLAPSYDNLPAVKNALHRAFTPIKQGGLGLQRDELWITMKANPQVGIWPIHELLQALELQYFDLFLWHLPHAGSHFDSEERLTQRWQALSAFDTAILPRIGVSNFYLPHLERLLAVSEKEGLRQPYANQIAYNLAEQPVDLLKFHQQHAIKTMAYSPLGFQFSTMLAELPSVLNLAQQIDSDPAQAQLAWLMAKDITVIPASVSKPHLQSNLAAMQYVDVVKSIPAMSQALDQDLTYSDIFMSCSATVQAAKQHAEELEWDVAHGHGLTL